MDITASLHNVTIYIHPDKGPVTPITLNMLDVEKHVVGIDSSSNRDQVRIEQTIKLIQTNFPGVRPYDRPEMIRHFVRRLGHVALFSGVVLRLPGVIQDDARPLPIDADQIANLEKMQTSLESEILQLKAKIQSLETDNDQQVQKNIIMEAQGKQYVEKFEELERRIKALQDDFSTAGEERDRAVDQARRGLVRQAELEQENAALQVKDQEAQLVHSKYLTIQSEVAELRQDKAILSKENDKLRDDLEKCGQEKNSLRDQLRREIERQQPLNPAPIDDVGQDWINR